MIGKKIKPLKNQIILRALLGPVLILFLVFVPAGKLLYWQGILYSAVTILSLGITYFSIYHNPELIGERLKPGEGMKTWDKIYFALSTPLFFITIILGSLDTGRFQWSLDLPVYSYVISVIVYLSGQIIFAWAKHSNNFFSSVVRIQKERGHRVSMEGPYKYVRHPGYLGGLLFTVTTPLILGSFWALIPTGLTIILMIIRTVLEDRTLEAELEGYREYKKKVRFRLLPYVW